MLRFVLHIVLGILMWVVFGYYWYLVFQRPVTPHTKSALIIVGSIVAFFTIFLVFWIFHNLRIARTKGRRKSRLTGVKHSTTDFLGRALVMADEDTIRRASYIEVHIVEDLENEKGKKVFHSTTLPPVPPEGSPATDV